jgi:hypothetical protein
MGKQSENAAIVVAPSPTKHHTHSALGLCVEGRLAYEVAGMMQSVILLNINSLYQTKEIPS